MIPRRLIAAIVVILGTPAFAAVERDYVSTRASHAAIMDLATGELLYGKNENEPVPPASMSKLMTVAVVLDLIKQGRLAPDTMFRVSEKAWRTGGSKMFVLVDTRIAVIDLLKGIIVQSGNDACIVVAENIAGGEAAFAELMNARARAWGLEQSHFANPTGLPHPEHRMSMHDLAKLARHIWMTYPEYRDLFGMAEFTWSDITQRNRNPLIGLFEGARGMKTGHTEEAGFGVVGLAERGGEGRIVVVTGLESERQRRIVSLELMETAFDDFDTQTFFERGAIVGAAEVFAGQADRVPLSIDQDVRFTLHRRRLEKAQAEISYRGPLRAPVKQGELVAILKLTIPGQAPREYPLYTAQPVRGLTPLQKIRLGLISLFTPPQPSGETP